MKMGYERVDQVQSIGQFSQRGDLIDIFPLNQPHPIRLEFYGDEIDSLRSFKVEDQISIESLETVLILPVREGLWHQPDFDRRRGLIESGIEKSGL